MCSLELLFGWQTSPPRESAKMRKSLTQSVSNRKPTANFPSDDWRNSVPMFGGVREDDWLCLEIWL